jgi:hypothetical protein
MGGFFTRCIQFAFGNGGDHSSYVSAKNNILSSSRNAEFPLAADGLHWKLASYNDNSLTCGSEACRDRLNQTDGLWFCGAV